MKLNEDFIMHNTGEEILLVPTAAARFHGLVQGNKAVEVILSCLQNDTTEDEILSVMKEKFDGDEEDMREDIRDVVKKLKEIGAIDG
ncbi:MAG: PqqD family protein [Ruminococcus sp.]|nr:PqqD family protein [Ruminococcus sp.]